MLTMIREFQRVKDRDQDQKAVPRGVALGQIRGRRPKVRLQERVDN